LAPVQLSVVEQRLDAARAMLAGADVVEVAALARCDDHFLTPLLVGISSRRQARPSYRFVRPATPPSASLDLVELFGLPCSREGLQAWGFGATPPVTTR
jgi:hypothetical protein